jgi:vanillate/3-O-methylgallate O-demethylase
VGQAKHVSHCTEAGKIIHEGILNRLGEDEFMLFGRGGFWVDYKLRQGHYDATSEQEDWFNYQVSGPKAIYVVEKAACQSLRDIKFMYSGKIHINGREIQALRQGMAGELGYELQGPREYAQEIYDAIMEAGKEFGIRQLGGRAVFINHLEACFPMIVTDYLPAIFGEKMKEYFGEFRRPCPRLPPLIWLAVLRPMM